MTGSNLDLLDFCARLEQTATGHVLLQAANLFLSYLRFGTEEAMEYAYTITANKYTYELALIADSNVVHQIAGLNEARLARIGENWVECRNRVMAIKTLCVAHNANLLPVLRPQGVAITQPWLRRAEDAQNHPANLDSGRNFDAKLNFCRRRSDLKDARPSRPACPVSAADIAS